jgi:mannosylglycerate hydrolase
VRIENRFAIVPSATGWRATGAVALAESFRNDVLVTRGTAPGGSPLPLDVAGLEVRGTDILVSSIRRVDFDGRTGTEVRLVAMSGTGSTAQVSGSFTEAATLDLLGRRLGTEHVDDGLELTLGPWEIRTIVVR